MKELRFRNGDILPSIGLGTWLAKPHEVYNAVLHAIEAGYRHFDCAYIYKNEQEIGAALQYAIKTGMVSRQELFITSKLWNSCHGPSQVEPALRATLDRLQLSYLDLYLIHWPIVFSSGKDQIDGPEYLVPLDKLPISVTWKSMETVCVKGLTRHIGVSNFNVPKLNELLKNSTLPPEVNQVELHPFLQQPELVRFCKRKNILVTAYSPLGSARYKNSKADVLHTEMVMKFAQKYRCTPSQLVLAWGIARGTAVIPKSVNKMHIMENLEATRLHLYAEDMKLMNELDKKMRLSTASYAVYTGGPYTLASIWKE